MIELLSGLIDNADPNNSSKDIQPIKTSLSSSSSSPPKRLPLQYRHSQNNIDFFKLSYTDNMDTVEEGDEEKEKVVIEKNDENKKDEKVDKSNQQQQQNESSSSSNDKDEDEINLTDQKRRNSTAKLIRELTQLTLQKDGSNKEKGEMRSIVIELEHDDEFFYRLMTELQSSVRLQKDTFDKFETDINELEKRMVKIVSKIS